MIVDGQCIYCGQVHETTEEWRAPVQWVSPSYHQGMKVWVRQQQQPEPEVQPEDRRARRVPIE
jgi:hypothetical protein